MPISGDHVQFIHVHYRPGPHISPDGRRHPPVGNLEQTVAATYNIDWPRFPPNEVLRQTERRMAARDRLIALARSRRETQP